MASAALVPPTSTDSSTAAASTRPLRPSANGAVLLTGAGIVPGDSFTQQARDTVRIGTLENPVVV